MKQSAILYLGEADASLKSKFPTKQQLKRKYDAVTPASSALFKSMLVSMDGHATPYMHHMLHTENYLKRDPLDRSGESIEHKNKKPKQAGEFTSHHLPSAANCKTAVAQSVLRRTTAAAEARRQKYQVAPTKHELRRARDKRRTEVVTLVDYSSSSDDDS